ncbi:YkvA family protein [Tissierella praeacuta]|uniref:YkvA family protein n=1 Tax=Tissierella praeacuta TaxID=43131 RepID=UPI0033405B08
MRIDVEEILRSLEAKANTIYFDKDRLKNLLNATKEKIEKNKTLMEIWDDIKLFIDLIRDWMKGDYKEISQGTIIMIIISLLYLVNPLDIIPDFLVGGFIDDLAVIAYVIKRTSEELKAYEKWRNEKDSDNMDKTSDENIIDMEDEINVEYGDIED